MWRGLGRGPEEPHARGAHAQHGREGGGTGHGRGGTCLPTQKSPRVPAAWAGPSQCAGRALSAARGEGELVRDAAGSLRPLPEPLSSSPLQPREESSRETGTCGVLWGDGALRSGGSPGRAAWAPRSHSTRRGPNEECVCCRTRAWLESGPLSAFAGGGRAAWGAESSRRNQPWPAAGSGTVWPSSGLLTWPRPPWPAGSGRADLTPTCAVCATSRRGAGRSGRVLAALEGTVTWTDTALWGSPTPCRGARPAVRGRV